MLWERHGMSNSPEYSIWRGIKKRCQYDDHYVKNGITVCSEWINNFPQFYADMGDKPTPNHTIDRINNDLGYEPGNCRWATLKEQQNNRTNNHNLTYKGVTQSISEWAREYNIGRQCLRQRVANGWEIERALNTPSRKKTPRKVA